VTEFRRFSRRRRRAALVVALLDRLEWGPPEVRTDAMDATQDAVCPACGTDVVVGDRIVLARVGPPASNHNAWIHETCPSYWDVLARTVERYDDKIITKINPAGRGRAAGCGHVVADEPVYLVRRPVPLSEPNHSNWYCEDCVTPRSIEG
jgi:hypothetical protein